MKMSKNFISFILQFFYLISFVKTQQTSNTYECGPKAHNLKVGDDVILCIHILSQNKKLAMPIKVDEYSMLSFNKIHDLINPEEEIELLAQIGETTTILPTVNILYIIIV